MRRASHPERFEASLRMCRSSIGLWEPHPNRRAAREAHSVMVRRVREQIRPVSPYRRATKALLRGPPHHPALKALEGHGSEPESHVPRAHHWSKALGWTATSGNAPSALTCHSLALRESSSIAPPCRKRRIQPTPERHHPQRSLHSSRCPDQPTPARHHELGR